MVLKSEAELTVEIIFLHSLQDYWCLIVVLFGKNLTIWLMCSLLRFTPSLDNLLQVWGKHPWGWFPGCLRL